MKIKSLIYTVFKSVTNKRWLNGGYADYDTFSSASICGSNAACNNTK